MTETRKTSRADELVRGDIVVDTGPTYREVRLVEPVDEDPSRVLVVYAGAYTENLPGAEVIDLATRDELDAAQRKIQDAAKRRRMRDGLVQLLSAIEDGLPMPYSWSIDASCMASADDVRTVADAFDVEPRESLNNGAPQIEAKVVLATNPNTQHSGEVVVRFWHLGDRPTASKSKHANGFRAPEVVAELERQDPTAVTE